MQVLMIGVMSTVVSLHLLYSFAHLSTDYEQSYLHRLGRVGSVLAGLIFTFVILEILVI